MYLLKYDISKFILFANFRLLFMKFNLYCMSYLILVNLKYTLIIKVKIIFLLFSFIRNYYIKLYNY